MAKSGAKLVNRLLTRSPATVLSAAVARTWFRTLRYRTRDWDVLAERIAGGEGTIFACWHRNLLLGLGHTASRKAHALVSPGRDGEMATRILNRLGVSVIRGSSGHNGERALLRMLEMSRQSDGGASFAVMCDGPRGPAEVAKTGAVYAAWRTGLPVVPVGMACPRTWELDTWDRLQVPKPFSSVTMLFGEPVHIPRDADRAALEGWREHLDRTLTDLNRRAAVEAGLDVAC